MRKIIEHIDERRWRTLEYFRLLDKRNQFQLNKHKLTEDIVVNLQNINRISTVFFS